MEKASLRETAPVDIGSPDAAASGLIGAAPSSDPRQLATLETVPQSMPQAGLPSGTAMAEANRAVALRVNRAIRSGQDTLTIELHPAELGHVAVRLAFHGNNVDVRMVVSRQETFQAFSQDRAALEQQFSQAGINLGSGGLDLRYGQPPAPEARQPVATGSPQMKDEPAELAPRPVLLGDNQINIVA